MSEPKKLYLLDTSAIHIAPLRKITAPFDEVEIIRFDKGADALKAAAKDKPVLILANWTLPDMQGPELIKGVQTLRPLEIPLLLFTAERPMREVQNAMRMGASDVLGLPIDWNFLHRHLVRLFEQTPSQPAGEYEEDFEVKILNQLDEVSRLTPLPDIAQRVLAISEDPKSSAGQLAEIVRQDATITANVLKVVNSAAYGYRREISNIQQAIVVLGFDEVRNITIAASLSKDLDLPESRLFQRRKFWMHSLAAGMIAQKIAQRNPEIDAEDAFIIGLLHDIGEVILDQHFHNEFTESLEKADGEKRHIALAERELMGVDHAEVGGVVARNWSLPVSLEKAIMYHHEPWRADAWNHAVYLAHVSNLLASVAGYSAGNNPKPEHPYPDAFLSLGLEGKSLKEIWITLGLDISSIKSLI